MNFRFNISISIFYRDQGCQERLDGIIIIHRRCPHLLDSLKIDSGQKPMQHIAINFPHHCQETNWTRISFSLLKVPKNRKLWQAKFTRSFSNWPRLKRNIECNLLLSSRPLFHATSKFHLSLRASFRHSLNHQTHFVAFCHYRRLPFIALCGA
jgi:hypothetical protein